LDEFFSSFHKYLALTLILTLICDQVLIIVYIYIFLGVLTLYIKTLLSDHYLIAGIVHLFQVIGMEDKLREIGGLPANQPIQLYEEINASDVRPLHERNRQLGEVMDKLMDGNIIIFQVATSDLPDASRYFLDIFYRVDVLLCDKNDPLDQGFIITLNRNLSYGQVIQTFFVF